MMDIMMMCEVYACIPGVVDFQEAKANMGIDREVRVRREMYGIAEE